MQNRNLHFVGGEKATGAGMLAMTKRGVLGTGGDEVALVLFARCVAPLEEATRVEDVGVVVDGGTPHVVLGNGDFGAFGYDCSIV